MKKRVIAAVTAAVLAMLGVVVLVVWAQGADERAYAGAERKTVLQVTDAVAAGKKVSEVESSFEQAKLPADAIPDGAVTDLAGVAGLTTLTDLQPGEVLLESRLGTPGEKTASATTVPAGYQEISVAVDPQHGVGGAIKAGDRVGFIATFEPKNGAQQFANFAIQNVLVTKVGRAVSTEDDLTGIMVTLAVKTLDAERVAYTSEWGKVWLTLQNAETDRSGAKLINAKDVVE
jgi:pilus assembly protein CpaB